MYSIVKQINKKENNMRICKTFFKTTFVLAVVALVTVFCSCEKKQRTNQNPNNDLTTGTYTGFTDYTESKDGNEMRDSTEVKADIEEREEFIKNNGPRLHFSGGYYSETAADSAVFNPVRIYLKYFPIFDSLYLPRGNISDILDTAITHIEVIKCLWQEHGKPYPVNGENIQKLYDLCDTIIKKWYELDTLRAELDSIRNKKPNVGIPVYGALREEELLRGIKEYEYRLGWEIEQYNTIVAVLVPDNELPNRPLSVGKLSDFSDFKELSLPYYISCGHSCFNAMENVIFCNFTQHFVQAV